MAHIKKSVGFKQESITEIKKVDTKFCGLPETLKIMNYSQ